VSSKVPTLRRSPRTRPRVLILIENLPLQRDARVKRQCSTLLAAGWDVTVVCPRSEEPLDEPLERVRLRTWRAPVEGSSRRHFLFEYATALVCSAVLVGREAVRGFDVIQACNPPDFFFLVAAPFRLLGVPFVFDHHDLTPELFAARFGSDSGFLARALRGLERATFATATHVIATNESVKSIAVDRGGRDPADVTVVRNGPVLADVAPREPTPSLRRGRSHLLVWHGVMGSADDGLDLALEMMAHLVHGPPARDDCHFVLLGDGEERPHLERLATRLGVEDHVSFPGWVSMDVVHDHLATASVGIVPDPKSPGVDKATVMKVMEYMAFEVPIVAFDVDETKVSAGDAAVYAGDNDPACMARLVASLLDDPAHRAVMGRRGRARIECGLAWDHQEQSYLRVLGRLVGGAAETPTPADRSAPTFTRQVELTSVIVPTRNRPTTLAQTLRTVLDQRHVEFEVIVVDDGPDPATAGLIRSLGDPRVRLVESGGAGSAAATRNVGLQQARGSWVAFCDDDDLWAPDKLASQHEAIQRTSSVWSCTGALKVDGDLSPIGYDPVDASGIDRLRSFNAVPGGGSGVLASRASVEQAGGFDESLRNSEDWDLWIRLSDVGSCAVVDRPLVAYRVWAENKSADLGALRRAIRSILERHHVQLDDAAVAAWNRYFLTRLTGPEHRREAAALAFDIARRERRPRTAARAAAVMLAPSFMASRADSRRRAAIPRVCLEETTWLSPLAATPSVERDDASER
jgi:glycosyltransferase involved in cell wall biosynthesis/GT2 family glycosyltransferase